MRYFFDPRNYRHPGKNNVPLPDNTALNGPAAMKACKKGGCPVDHMVEVEALRYLFLNNLPLGCPEGKVNSKKPLHVLVLGDYSPVVTRHQMELLMAAAGFLPSNIRYTVKSHPACAIKDSDYPSLQLLMTNAPLEELLVDCDVTFTSNITSAAVDAYSVGVPVVSVLDGDTFNMSPLRDLEGVVYVTNPTELADALRNARSHKGVIADHCFFLDKDLPRWRKLLSLNLLKNKSLRSLI
jgi:surface carbohydrate biosynthesis protein (TIGR04326 family)